MSELLSQFGQIDIYLFDQILRGRIARGMTVLDAGCGTGRNLHYLLRAGFNVLGVDNDPASIAAVRRLSASLAPQLPSSNFLVQAVEHMTIPESSVDVVISSAVLHLARDHEHFRAMLEGSWRVLKREGVFFCRLASSIGFRAVEPAFR